MDESSRLTLVTTAYPAAAKFLENWAASVAAQEDSDFDCCIAVDGMSVDDVCAAAGRRVDATWVMGTPGDTPASLRGRAIELMTRSYAAIVFVDSDDVLLPNRIADARERLRNADAVACRLELVDEAGRSLGRRMPARPPGDLYDRLRFGNIFGLSNTAYRVELLLRCLPIPRDCVLVDWYLATRAALNGGRLGYDDRPGMLYRQHGQNVAKPRLRSAAELERATTLVRAHHTLLLRSAFAEGDPRAQLWRERADDVAAFARMLADPVRAAVYVRALNEIELEYHWWEGVAYGGLEALWR